eukprot:Gb_04697 [translate_table: standard]
MKQITLIDIDGNVSSVSSRVRNYKNIAKAKIASLPTPVLSSPVLFIISFFLLYSNGLVDQRPWTVRTNGDVVIASLGQAFGGSARVEQQTSSIIAVILKLQFITFSNSAKDLDSGCTDISLGVQLNRS